MKIENRKRVAKIRKLFFMVSVVIAMAALVLFLLDFVIPGIAGVGIFALWFLFFQVADYQYILFSNDNRRILLRHYKAVRFGKGEFNSIDFPAQILQNAYFENSIFGKMSDLTLVVKTKRGMAEYPSVSLTALSKEERKQVQKVLNEILGV